MAANGRRPMAATALVGAWAILLAAASAAAAEGYVTARMVPAGWVPAGETQAFQADNLYEHIDGAAPGYVRYSFKELTVQTLHLADDPNTEIMVEVYAFGNHLDAFGIYSNERAPKLDYVKLGTEGYYVANACRFYTGAYYVKLSASRDNEQVQTALKSLAPALARALRGESRPPKLLKAIPTEGLVANSERYEGSDLLAHDFLGAGFTADYDLGGEKPAKLFFAIKLDSTQARSAYYELLSFLRERGEVGERVSLSHGSGRVTKHPFYGPSLICRSGAVVCGVLRVPSEEAGRALVDDLLARLGGMDLLTGAPCLPGPRCCR
jgi:hypothetical protein